MIKKEDLYKDIEKLFDGVLYDYDNDLIDKINKKISKEINSLDESDKLKKQWNEVNTTVKNAFLNNLIANLLKFSTGAGKTATVIMYILNILRYTKDFMGTQGKTAIVLLGQQYKQGVNEFERQIEKFAQVPINYIVLEGKGRVCLHRFDPIVVESEKMGLSINYLCKKCDCREATCPYFCNVDKLFPPPQVNLCLTVSHQINKFVPILLKKVEQMFIIIDEDFENSIKTNNKIYLSTLQKNIRFLEKAINWEENKKEIKTFRLSGFEMLLDFLILLEQAIVKEPDYERMKDVLDILVNSLERTFVDTLNSNVWKILEKIAKQTNNLDNNIKHKKNIILPFTRFYFYHILSFVENYKFMIEKDPTNIDNWLKMAILRLKIKPKKTKEQKNTKQVDDKPQYCLGMLYYDFSSIVKMLETGKITKLIINDATASVLKLKKLFGDYLKVYEKDMISNNLTIYQIKYRQRRKASFDRKYAYYPQTSIQRFSTLILLIRDVKTYIYAHPEIKNHLFVSRPIKIRTTSTEEQPNTLLWDFLAKKLNGKIDRKEIIIRKQTIIQTFISLKGDLKGTTIFLEKYPLAGTNDYENINSTILFGTPDIPSGHINRESTFFNIDPNKYREEKAKTEMKQAMGRMIRGVNDKFCLELSGLDFGLKNVENVNLMTFINHKELQGHLVDLGDKKRNILSKTELEKIMEFLNKNDNRITRSDCMTLFNISYYIASEKLNSYVAIKKLKIKLVSPPNKIGRPKAVYYL